MNHHRVLHRLHDSPSLDAHLINFDGLPLDVAPHAFHRTWLRRGAMALGRASDYCNRAPTATS